jgi:hypothetical protein
MKDALKHFTAAAVLAALPLTAAADGEGRLDDGNLNLSYTSDTYFLPNPLVYEAGLPTCELDPELCDIFTLTVDLSSKLRSDGAAHGLIEFFLEATGDVADFDLYVYDANGTLVASSETDGGEYLALDLEQLPNGTYEVWLVPYTTAGDSAQLDIMVSGIKGKSGLAAVFGGAMPLTALLLGLGLAALRRGRFRIH